MIKLCFTFSDVISCLCLPGDIIQECVCVFQYSYRVFSVICVESDLAMQDRELIIILI